MRVPGAKSLIARHKDNLGRLLLEVRKEMRRERARERERREKEEERDRAREREKEE